MAKRMLSRGVRKQGWNFKGPFGRHQLYHHCFLFFTLLRVRILEFHDAPSLDFNVPVKSKSLWQWTKPRVVANSQHKHHVLCPGDYMRYLATPMVFLGDLWLFVQRMGTHIWLAMGQSIKLIQTRLRRLPLSSKGNGLDSTCITR